MVARNSAGLNPRFPFLFLCSKFLANLTDAQWLQWSMFTRDFHMCISGPDLSFELQTHIAVAYLISCFVSRALLWVEQSTPPPDICFTSPTPTSQWHTWWHLWWLWRWRRKPRYCESSSWWNWNWNLWKGRSVTYSHLEIVSTAFVT